MNKEELVEVVANETGFTKKDVSTFVNAFTEVISEALSNSDKVQLVGFGSFDVRNRKERIGRNPKTGEQLTIPESKIPVFKASSSLKDFVNEV